ncbi:uncharacterized protein WCC33_018433, partial [Rhinophrynus dorsalis]
SLLQQLRNLQALVRQCGGKNTTSSTCLMVLALSFCLILFPNFFPFGARVGQHHSRVVRSRQLQEVHPDPALNTVVEQGMQMDNALQEKVLLEAHLDDSLLDLSLQEVRLDPSLQGAQNDTPEVQDMGTAETKSSINSNSSSDLPAENQQAPAVESGSALVHPDPAHVPHVVTGKQDWLERPRSVVITQRHSDEM